MKNVNLQLIITIAGIVMVSCGPMTEPLSMDESPTKSVTERPPTMEHPTIVESPSKPVADVPSTTEAVTVIPDEPQGIPDKPLSSDGPWWIFSIPEGLFAINPDGSGLTQFYYGPINSPYSRQILTSISGGHLAYLIGESYDATLKITKFPGPTLVIDKPLITFDSDPEMDAIRAIVEYQSLAFSPDGRFLAFMGIIEGPTSDLYLYSLDSFEIMQLTDGPSQAYQPVWSPDGKYIVHIGVSTFGSGAGSAMSGVWAAQVDNSDVATLYDPSGSGSETIIGWVDDQTFVVHSWDMSCGAYNLRTFNIETKESTKLWVESFRSIAFDQSNAVAVLSSNDGEGSPDSGAGIYIVPTDGNVPQRIVENTGPQVIWSQDANLFLVLGDFGSWSLAVDSRGQFIDLDMPQGAQVFPAVAPGSRDLAWPGKSLWIGSLLGSIDNPPKEIFNEPVYTVTWAPDGQSVIFFADSGLYIAHQPDYTPILIAEGLDNRNGYSGWMLP
jgi:hypothetical protein